VIVEMCYQMGVPGVFKFVNMVAALMVKNYERAAEEMLDSKWAKSDSPKRALALAKIMREGS
jgi:lysozyme